MGYNLAEPQNFISIKLTDAGRRQLSLGQLNFTSAVLSDREINYGIDRTNTYNITNNRILSPVDVEPVFSNYDGSNVMALGGQQVTSAKQYATASTQMAGFFSGTTNNWQIDTTLIKGIGTFQGTHAEYIPSGTTGITIQSTYYPTIGDLAYIPWQPIQLSGSNPTTLFSGSPVNGLWYEVVSTSAGSGGDINVGLDRPVPNFSGVTGPAACQNINIYFYPNNSLGWSTQNDPIANYYGSAYTVDTRVWNMNIVRTNSVIGTPLTISGYTSYGSIQYNGTKQYLGFSAETPAIGIIHYTNSYSGNTYAEQLVEGSVQLSIPQAMWHNNGADNGQGVAYGLNLYDVNGNTYFDSISNTTYRNLQDSVSSTGNIVGRVYHKLKLIVITDQELLTALSYDSNRCYTLPQLNLNLTSNPKYPLVSSQATGLCQTGYTYYVTYLTSSNPYYAGTSNFAAGSSYGYPQAMHCSYVSSIQGSVDSLGNPQFLTASFPLKSFPYLRSYSDMNSTSLSGTGWNANKVQLLVCSYPTSYNYGIDDLPANGWKLVSTNIGNGIYTGDTTDLTIDPVKLSNYNFIISAQDVASGTTYVLNSGMTVGQNVLNFGDEAFFFGTLQTNILATTYKSVVTVFAANDKFDTSINSSFDDTLDTNTYITEIGVLDNLGNLVAIGKPTYPITKNNGRFLAFQLEIDF